jgi:hypothetical protein
VVTPKPANGRGQSSSALSPLLLLCMVMLAQLPNLSAFEKQVFVERVKAKK